MKKYFTILVLTIATLTLVTGCSTTDTTTTSTTATTSTSTTTQTSTTTETSTTSSTTTSTIQPGGVEYYPHSEGASWQYLVTVTSTTGAVYEFTYYQTFEGTTTVGQTTVQKLPNSLDSDQGQLIEVSDGYVKSYGTIGSPTIETSLILNFPLTLGASWITLYGDVYGTTLEVKVDSFESLTVPAGTFECFKIMRSLAPKFGVPPAYVWYGANVGMVKTSSPILSESGGTDQSSEVSFTVTGTMTYELINKNF